METKLNGLGNGSVGTAIEESELKQRDRASGECVFIHNAESTKQWVEPKSTNAETAGILRVSKVMEGMRELGSERADVLRQISIGAQSVSMQSPGCVEYWRLWTSFLTLKEQEQRLQGQLSTLLPSRLWGRTWGSP